MENETVQRENIDEAVKRYDNAWWAKLRVVQRNLKAEHVTVAMRREEDEISEEFSEAWHWLQRHGVTTIRHLEMRDDQWVARKGVDLYQVVTEFERRRQEQLAS